MNETKNKKWFIAYQIAKSVRDEVELSSKQFRFIAIKYRRDDFLLNWTKRQGGMKDV